MLNIVIIGAGQLGSRHLQSLTKCINILNIYVVDSSMESLRIAKIRFDECNQNFKGTVSYLNTLSDLPNEIEIAIVATSAKSRKLVLIDLLNKRVVKNLILEKFLFINEKDFFEVKELLFISKTNTYVNCPRRLIDFYSQVKAEITTPFQFTVTGNNWGLGCNGIHFVDLFSYLSNSTNITISNSLVANSVLESKREGYFEFSGTITGDDGLNSFSITSFNSDISPVQILISSPTIRYLIIEGSVSKINKSELKNNWVWETTEFKFPMQSELTHLVIDEILNTGRCSLTTYEKSMKLHLIFLKTLLSKLRLIKNDNLISECPIT